MQDETLFTTPQENVDLSSIDPLVRDFILIFDQFQLIYLNMLRANEVLQNMRDSVANIDDPNSSNRRTNVSMAFKCTNNIAKQADIPSWQIICGGMSENQRVLTQSLVECAMEKCGWRKVLIGKKNGAIRESMSIGGSLVGFGTTRADQAFPFTYWNVNYCMFGTNVDANEFCNPGSEHEVRKLVVIKEYQTPQLLSMEPQLDGHITEGIIPGLTNDYYYTNNKTELQRVACLAHRTQKAFAYDLDYKAKDGTRGLYMEFVGASAYLSKRLEGKQYPWRNADGDAEVPYDMLTCFARQRGLLDYGILHICYKLGIMHATLENMGITYTLTNSNPIRIVNTTMTETEIALQAGKALKRANDGELPIMLNKDGKEFSGVGTFQTAPIIAELNGMLELIEKDLMQMGFNINDIATDTTKTLGALQLEVAATTAGVQYIQNSNAHVYEHLLQMFLQALVGRKKDDSNIILVPDVDKYKLRNGDGNMVGVSGVPQVDDTGTQVVTDGKGNPKMARNWTLQDLKEQLTEFGEVRIQVSGGVQNNPALSDASARDIIATSDPTSRASLVTRSNRARQMGINFEPEDFLPGSGIPQQAQQPQQPGQQGQAGAPTPAPAPFPQTAPSFGVPTNA